MTREYHSGFGSSFRQTWLALWLVLATSSLVVSILALTRYRHLELGMPGWLYPLVFLVWVACECGVAAAVLATIAVARGRRAGWIGLTLTVAALVSSVLVPVWGRVFEWQILHRGGSVNVKSLAFLGIVIGGGAILGLVASWWLRCVTRRRTARSWALLLLGALFACSVGLLRSEVEPLPKALPTANGLALGGHETRPPAPQTIVILSFDALRADHLSAYGYERQTSPELDRFLEAGLLFENAAAPKAKTGPSLASLMTGLYPIRHGALRHGWSVVDSVPALPGLIKGYETAAFVANSVPRKWLEQRPFDVSKFYRAQPAAQVLADASTWLASTDAEKVLLWVHLIEPHTPYEPPAGDLEPFLSDAWFEVDARTPYDLEAAARKLAMPAKADPAEVRQRVNLEVAKYDAYIRSSTREAAAFLDQVLAARGGGLFVITADHGESMVEHDFFFWHGEYCYQSVVHIPLALYWPAAGLTGRTDRPASLVDVLPTLCGVVGCVDPPIFDGIDLLAAQVSSPASRTVYTSALDNPWYSRWSSIQDSVKLIATPKREWTLVDGWLERRASALAWLMRRTEPLDPYRFRQYDYELYDLDEDPEELDNLAEQQSTILRGRASELMRWLDLQYELAGHAGATSQQEMSDDTLEELRALGYIN